MTSWPLIPNNFILRRPIVAIFPDIIKTVLKQSLKTQKKLKGLGIMYQNATYICFSWYSKICWFPLKKCWCQQNSRSVSRDSHNFWIFLRLGITVPSFIILGYVWQILGRGTFLPIQPYIFEQPRKGLSWIGLRQKISHIMP